MKVLVISATMFAENDTAESIKDDAERVFRLLKGILAIHGRVQLVQVLVEEKPYKEWGEKD